MLASSAITLILYAITLTKLFVVGVLITVVSWLAGWWQFAVAAALAMRGLTGVVLVSGPATASCSGSLSTLVPVVGHGCDATWLQQGLNDHRHDIRNICCRQRAISFSFSWVAPLLLICCLLLPAVAENFEPDLSLVVFHITLVEVLFWATMAVFFPPGVLGILP